MGCTARDGRGTVVARLLGVLAVLLGLLAMHGLTSTHHAAAALPVPPAVAQGAAATGHGHGQQSPTEIPAGAATDPAAAPPVGALALGLPAPVCDGDCQADTAVLCLAVLAAACAVAVLTAAARRPAGLGHCLYAEPASRPSPRYWPSAPDPVKDLCVSRT